MDTPGAIVEKGNPLAGQMKGRMLADGHAVQVILVRTCGPDKLILRCDCGGVCWGNVQTGKIWVAKAVYDCKARAKDRQAKNTKEARRETLRQMLAAQSIRYAPEDCKK